jgi:hypothetical protein
VKLPTVSIPELRTLLADAKRPMTAAEIAEAHFGQTDRELIDYVNGRLSTESRKPANKPNQIVKIEKPGQPSLYWTVENYRTPEPLPAMVPVERAPAPDRPTRSIPDPIEREQPLGRPGRRAASYHHHRPERLPVRADGGRGVKRGAVGAALLEQMAKPRP